MRSIEKRFKQMRDTNPNLSDLICFARAIRGQKFTRETLNRWFKVLVDKHDYVYSDKISLLEHLESVANMPEDAGNRAKFSI